jgi:hypothetical protein
MMTLDTCEFIRRFLIRVLPQGFHRIGPDQPNTRQRTLRVSASATATAWSANGCLDQSHQGPATPLRYSRYQNEEHVQVPYRSISRSLERGAPLPPRLASEITREIARLALIS